MTYFDVAVAAIFARELLEGAVILTQYRTLVRTSKLSDDEKSRYYKMIYGAAAFAALVAFVLIVIVYIVLNSLGNEFDDRVSELIEGVSKIVAAVCIAQLSLKVPKWLQLYGSKEAEADLMNTKTLLFNVAWNIWREIAEIGVFLIPSFLSKTGLDAIGLSALCGVVIAAILGFTIDMLQKCLSKGALAAFCAILTGWLAVGLFTGGCHEIEEYHEETDVAFYIRGDFWDQSKFPMAVFRPFGYSDHPTQLMVGAFWSFAGVLTILHIIQHYRLKKRAADNDARYANCGTSDVEMQKK